MARASLEHCRCINYRLKLETETILVNEKHNNFFLRKKGVSVVNLHTLVEFHFCCRSLMSRIYVEPHQSTCMSSDFLLLSWPFASSLACGEGLDLIMYLHVLKYKLQLPWEKRKRTNNKRRKHIIKEVIFWSTYKSKEILDKRYGWYSDRMWWNQSMKHNTEFLYWIFNMGILYCAITCIDVSDRKTYASRASNFLLISLDNSIGSASLGNESCSLVFSCSHCSALLHSSMTWKEGNFGIVNWFNGYPHHRL